MNPSVLHARLADAARRFQRKSPPIVQYVPCVARPDGTAARAAVKPVLGEMLTSFWPSLRPSTK